MPGRSRLSFRWPVVAAISLLLTACGSSPTTPSPPTTGPLPRIDVSITPNPVVAALRSTNETGSVYRVEATVTFRETSGSRGQITQIQGTIVMDPGGNALAQLAVALPIPANGTVVQTLFQDFSVGSTSRVIWRIAATGIDDSGRPFTTSAAEVAVEPPAAAPPPIAVNDRLELWGGPNYTQFLGCMTCNRFESDSIFNEFGSYGSRFSATSIWNRFGTYGSRFSPDSPCNQFATNPPRVINVTAGTFLGELTLNRFRSNAITEPAVVAWLEGAVCGN